MSMSKPPPPALAQANRLRPGRPPPDSWRGEPFLGSVGRHGKAPGTGLCAIGTMAKFCALSLAEHKLHLEAHPQQVGRVDPVALVEGTLLATVEHWPKAPEVVGVRLTDAIARTLGMRLSFLTGKVTTVERALLAAWWPEVL